MGKSSIIAWVVVAALCGRLTFDFVSSFDRVQIRLRDTEALELPSFSSAPIRDLTIEEVARFKTVGLLVLRKVLPLDYIRALQVYEEQVPSEYSSSENHLRQPGVDTLLFDSPVLQLLGQATGARSLHYIRDRIFSAKNTTQAVTNEVRLAMQDGTKASTLHLDSGPITPSTEGVSVAIALSDISELEGCTEFVDTSDPLLTQQKVNILRAHGRRHLMADVVGNTFDSVALNETLSVTKACMEPGDMAIFNFNILHRSGGTEVLRKKLRKLWTMRFHTDAAQLGWDPLHAQASLAKELEFSRLASHFVDNAMQCGLYEENTCLVWTTEGISKEGRSCGMVELGLGTYTRTLLRGLKCMWTNGYASAVVNHLFQDFR